MNLPDTAMEFLDAFRGVLHPDNADGRGLSGIYDSQEKMPRIHCYAFTRLRDEELAAAELRKVRVYSRTSADLVVCSRAVVDMHSGRRPRWEGSW